MKLTDFARLHNISDRHARRLFAENQADIDGHYTRRGKAGTEIDDVAAEILASKLQKPAGTPLLPGSTREQEYVSKYVDLSIRYTDLAEEYRQKVDELSKTKDQLAESNKAVALLEAAKEDKAKLEGRVKEAEDRAKAAEEDRRATADEAHKREQELKGKLEALEQDLKAEIERNRDLQSMSLFDRIFRWRKKQ